MATTHGCKDPGSLPPKRPQVARSMALPKWFLHFQMWKQRWLPNGRKISKTAVMFVDQNWSMKLWEWPQNRVEQETLSWWFKNWGLLSPRKPQRIWIELGTKRDKWIPIETPHGDPCSVFAAIEKVVSRITCLTGQQNSFRQGNQPNCQMPLWEGLILYCFLAKEVENSDLLNLDSSNHTPQTQLWMTAAPSFCFFCFRSRQVVFHQIPKDTGTALDPWHHFFRQQNKQTHDLGTPQNKSP